MDIFFTDVFELTVANLLSFFLTHLFIKGPKLIHILTTVIMIRQMYLYHINLISLGCKLLIKKSLDHMVSLVFIIE